MVQFGFDCEEIFFYLGEDFGDSFVSFGGSGKVFDAFVLFGDVLVENFPVKIGLASHDIKQRIRSLFLDMIIVVGNLLKGFRGRDVIGDDTGVRSLIVVGDNCSISLLSTSIIVVVPGMGAFGDIEVDRECGDASVFVEVLLVAGEEGGFAGAAQAEGYYFVLRDVLRLLVERAAVHHGRKGKQI